MKATHADPATGLAMALIEASNAPLLLLDGDCRVLAASSSFCEVFQLDPEKVADRPLAQLGEGEWAVPQLDALLRATASGNVQVGSYEMDLKRERQEERRLVIQAQKLDYGDADTVRLILTVADVTRARLTEKLKDDLLRDKSTMLVELQHRVANSLQIIASVLLQSAGHVQSDETRGHLHDAHSRIMSVAAIQQQLARASVGDIALRPYFTDLCRSIGASMISDPEHLSVKVDADGTVVASETAISLGLMVTELVINALKHAFPDKRHGEIKVEYHADGPVWALSVSDNGIGMPPASTTPHIGLGTTIVQALAKKLDASVKIFDAKPGTKVSIVSN